MDGLGIGVTVLRDLLEGQAHATHVAQDRSREQVKGENRMDRVIRINIEHLGQPREEWPSGGSYPFHDIASALRFLTRLQRDEATQAQAVEP